MSGASLQDGFEWASGVMANVKPDQMPEPSTCHDWTVRMLLNHMIGAVQAFAEGVPQGRISNSQPDVTVDLFGDDPAAAYDAAWPRVVAAWEAADPDGATEFPWGPVPNAVASQLMLFEAAVHGWDLARSTGQGDTIPDDLAQPVLALSTMLFSDPANRGHDFGLPIEVGDDASTTARLVAYLGRQPG